MLVRERPSPRRRSKLADGCDRIYLDIGTNVGVQIRKLYHPDLFPGTSKIFDSKFGQERSTVCSFGFEPNPSHSSQLKLLEDSYVQAGYRVKIFPVACSNVSGKASFVREEYLLDFEQSRAEHNKNLDYVVVPVIDFAAWFESEIVGRLHDPEKSVIVAKSDIEGHDDVMWARMIAKGLVCHIDYIYGEHSSNDFITSIRFLHSHGCKTTYEFLNDESYHDIQLGDVKFPLPAKKSTSPDKSQISSTESYTRHADLIFDIGMNMGHDVIIYLRQNYRVLGVEAVGSAVQKAIVEQKMENLIGRRLAIEQVAIGKEDGENIPFYRNLIYSEWSSLNFDWGCRGPKGADAPSNSSFCEVSSVRVTTCKALFKKYGVPVFLKIDIEGGEENCLRDLSTVPRSERPLYVSYGITDHKMINFLVGLGYGQFKVVPQMPNNRSISIPFGEDASDYTYGNFWTRSIEELNKEHFARQRGVHLHLKLN